MRSQISAEIVMSMLVALSLALFLSACLSGSVAAFARGEHALAGAANSTNQDLEGMLRSFGRGSLG